MAKLTDFMERLRRLASDTPPMLPGFTGAEAMQGEKGAVRFIVTRDHDGRIELSLSLPGPRRPSTHTVNDFFVWLGKKPVSAVKRPGTWHFVMERGLAQ